MMREIRDTTVAEAIVEVLELAREPLSGREIFARLPFARLVKPLSYRAFWQHFGMIKKRKRYPIARVPCADGARRRWCYVIVKDKGV